MIARIVPLLLAFAVSLAAAKAGAWTLRRGHWQVFSTVTQSEASVSFDAAGHADLHTSFNKLLIQNCLEYGLTDRVTLFAIPAFVDARVTPASGVAAKITDTSLEAGARLLLLGRAGKLSLQASYKTAGAFDLSVSTGRNSGSQAELRLLYGTGFRLFGRDGFADIQVAQRWIQRPRPDETPIDLTAGLWITKSVMLMAQSFNIVSDGDAGAPYTYYRSHKLELSVTQKLSRHWSIQVGTFYSPAGQNALTERGVQISLWTQD